MCVCVRVRVCPSQSTNGLPALLPPRTRNAMREREVKGCERKKLASLTTAFGLWTECNLGLWTTSDLYSFLSASAHRPLYTCRRKGGRTSSRQRVSDGSFGRTLQALREAFYQSSHLRRFSFKIFEESPSLSP